MSNNEISESFNMTKLGLLPDGWEVVKLGDVTEKTKQKDPRKTPEWRFKYVDVSSISRDALKIAECKLCHGKDAPSRAKKLVKRNDVIFATVRPTLKRLTLIDEEFDGEICSTAFCILRATEHILNPLYLFYAVQRDVFIDEFEKVQRGASYPAITDSDVKNQSIPLPPLPEQHRIAAVLSAVQDAKEKSGAVIVAAKSLKKSLMRHLFTYGPVPAGAAESVPLVGTEIGLVPEGWEVVRLGEYTKVRYGLGQPPKLADDGVPMIRATNIKRGKITPDGLIRIKHDAIPLSRDPFLKEEGIIVVRSGAYTGDLAMITKRWDGSIAGYDLIVSPLATFNPSYLSEYLLYDVPQSYFASQKARSAQPHLNARELSNTIVPLPSYLVQQKIASIHSTVDKKIETEENKKKALDELFKSLLHNLMTAKIRVNHLEVVQ
ncbi:hypothetical protein DRO03_00985 [Methanosarcinales archaeon]|nr:MAG: hypothetical protein DRO03_00985 [Methanosarcinales archaeon]